MNTEEDEFVVCGSGGTAEDARLDDLVGVIEDFMANFDADLVFRRLPPLSSVASDHKRYRLYREALARAEAELDAHVMAHCSSINSLEEATAMLSSRGDEVAEEVWNFIAEGCFDYATFVELWSEKNN